MARHKDADWNLVTLPNGRVETWEQAGIAVLMDIRDRLNVLNCWSFQDIPNKLDRIARQTSRPQGRKRQPQAEHARRFHSAARRARVLRRAA